MHNKYYYFTVVPYLILTTTSQAFITTLIVLFIMIKLFLAFVYLIECYGKEWGDIAFKFPMVA